ncbi:hypothetical protein BaRGS_00000198, partial [Batillaria attramentaria]
TLKSPGPPAKNTTSSAVPVIFVYLCKQRSSCHYFLGNQASASTRRIAKRSNLSEPRSMDGL